MRQVYYLTGLITSLFGIYFVVSSIAVPGSDSLHSALLVIIIGQLGFIQGNQQ